MEKVSSLRIVWDSWEDLDLFVPLYHQNMKRLQAQSHYFFAIDYFRALQRGLHGNFHLMSLFDDEKYLGGVCFFALDGIVQYHLPACHDDWREAGLPKLLVHELVKWGREHNFNVLHLGGGVGGKDNSLAYFKSGFSDLQLPFRTYKIIVDVDKYNAGCLVARQRAEREGGRLSEEYFPEYRGATVTDLPEEVAA
jgi:GNAT superfamily N-acetyltransferase